MAGADADTVEDAVIATLINRAMEVVTQDKITPSLYREVVGLVVRLREQKISMERLRLERARFDLDVADLVMKHIDKLKSSVVLQIEDRGEAAKKIRELMFGKYTKEQLEAANLAPERSLIRIGAVPDFQIYFANYFPAFVGAMNHKDDELGSDIERERREIAELQQKVKQLVSRNEGPRKERREDELKKLRHNIDVAENVARPSA